MLNRKKIHTRLARYIFVQIKTVKYENSENNSENIFSITSVSFHKKKDVTDKTQIAPKTNIPETFSNDSLYNQNIFKEIVIFLHH
jgi:hypothetical protein